MRHDARHCCVIVEKNLEASPRPPVGIRGSGSAESTRPLVRPVRQVRAPQAAVRRSSAP